MATRPRQMVQFSPSDLERIRLCLAATGQSYSEFVAWATMEAVTELEGLADAYRSREAQQRTQGW